MIGKRLVDIATLLGCVGRCSSPVISFEVDSRKIVPGSLFFALKGENVDGHTFLEDAVSRGALAAVVSKEYKGEVRGLELIRVENVLASLHYLAALQVKQKNMRCIAVTGSVGKTTTKEFIATILQGHFSVGKTPGNANSQVGLPLSLLNMADTPEVFVAEVGMSQKGEIAALLPIISPEIVVVTKVALAHALYFPDGLEGVAQAKAEILGHPNTKKVFLNSQVAAFKAFQKQHSVNPVFYGFEKTEKVHDAAIFFKDQAFFIETPEGVSSPFPLPFTATHFAENFLAAALVARELGLGLDAIIERAQFLAPYKMRFEKIEKDGVLYLNDSYNANPASMKAALENLPKPLEGGKVIAVLGEMKELGVFSKQAHIEVGHIASIHADILFCLGSDCLEMLQEFRKSKKFGFYGSSLQELKDELARYINKGDVVLIKGSNSLKMWELLS